MKVMNWDSGQFRDLDVDALLQSVSASAAAQDIELEDGVTPNSVNDIQEGSKFKIPMLIPEELESGDGRKMKKEALSNRDLPIPLLWQPKTGQGHDGSYIVGRIDKLERIEGGLGNAEGVFDTGPYGREAERLVGAKMLRGVSADLDQFEATVDGEQVEDLSKISTEKLTVDKARVMAATLVAKPAFQECTIELVNDDDMGDEAAPIADGVYEELPSDEFAAAEKHLSALAASAAPVNPPQSWFNNPELTGPTPLTVDDDGRVYGHVATWETDHIAYNYGVRPPRSRSNYAYFRTGLVRTAEGDDVAVGQLTLAGGHAPLDADAHKAVQHYDDTASAVADVACGEDQFGIWVAGGLRPGVTPEQVRTLRASAPSGDWRPINGVLEMVAVCQVNVPGFPIARARVASGHVMALVAAGTTTLARIKTNQLEELVSRIDAMEKRELARQKAELAAKFAPIQEMRKQRMIDAANAAREKLAPEFEVRRQKAAELTTRAEEARARISEFKLTYKGDWNPALHPRDRMGRFKEVLARLTDILNSDNAPVVPSAQAAKVSLEKAVKLDGAGNQDGARAAAEDAAKQLEEAARDAGTHTQTGNDLRNAAKDVAHEVNRPDDMEPDPTDTAEPSEGEGENVPAPDMNITRADVPGPVMRAIDQVAHDLGEGINNIDPKEIISRLDETTTRWLTGRGFTSPSSILRLILKLTAGLIGPGPSKNKQ